MAAGCTTSTAEVAEGYTSNEDTVPGQVVAMTGQGPLVQTGEGHLTLTDFAVEGGKGDVLVAMAGANVPVILG